MKKSKNKWWTYIAYILLFVFIYGGPFYFINFIPKVRDYNREPQAPEWTGVISFWDFPRLDKKTGTNFQWIYEKIKAFERANPGVYIDFTPLDWEMGNIKLDTAIKMGTPPDILPITSNYSILDQEVLEVLEVHLTSEEIKAFRENAIEAVSYNGHIWGIPWMISTYTMVLNLDLFEKKAVLPPTDGIWTYEEFVEKLQQLTYDSKDKDKIDHFGFNSFIQPGYYNTWGILLSDGGEIFDSNLNYIFYDEKALTGLKKLMDLKRLYGVIPPTFGENTSNIAWTSFYKDKNIAVYPVGTWALNALENLRDKGEGFEYTIAHYPVGSLGNPVTINSGVGAYGVSKEKDRDKLKMCIKFLKYLSNDEHQRELDRLGVLPVKKAVENIYENDPLMSMIYDNIDNIKIIPLHPYWKEIDHILQNEIRMGLLEKKTAEEVLADARSKIELFLKTIKR